MNRPGTRKAATKEVKSPQVSSGIGVREWLEELELHAELPVAADPRHARRSSKAPTPRRPRRRGIRQATGKARPDTVAEPEHFWVADSQGPLRDGELERIREFGRAIESGLVGDVRDVCLTRTRIPPSAVSSLYQPGPYRLQRYRCLQSVNPGTPLMPVGLP